MSPKGEMITLSYKLKFDTTNNITKYEIDFRITRCKEVENGMHVSVWGFCVIRKTNKGPMFDQTPKCYNLNNDHLTISR